MRSPNRSTNEPPPHSGHDRQKRRGEQEVPDAVVNIGPRRDKQGERKRQKGEHQDNGRPIPAPPAIRPGERRFYHRHEARPDEHQQGGRSGDRQINKRVVPRQRVALMHRSLIQDRVGHRERPRQAQGLGPDFPSLFPNRGPHQRDRAERDDRGRGHSAHLARKRSPIPRSRPPRNHTPKRHHKQGAEGKNRRRPRRQRGRDRQTRPNIVPPSKPGSRPQSPRRPHAPRESAGQRQIFFIDEGFAEKSRQGQQSRARQPPGSQPADPARQPNDRRKGKNPKPRDHPRALRVGIQAPHRVPGGVQQTAQGSVIFQRPALHFRRRPFGPARNEIAPDRLAVCRVHAVVPASTGVPPEDCRHQEGENRENKRGTEPQIAE